MYSNKKIAYLGILIILTGVFLTACRIKSPKEAPETFEGVELTYYKVFDDADVIEPIINQYVADHPGLKINYKKFSNFEEYYDLVLNEMAEGEGPDILSMQNTWFVANYKKLAPMPEEFGTPADFEETFVDVAYKDLVRTDVQGYEQVYALPMTVDTLAIYYNKDHFEDRIPSRGRPADTWEGIKEDVTLLNKEDSSFDRFEVSGIAMGRSDNITRAVDILYLLFLQHGLDFYNDNISEAIFANQQGGFVNFPAREALELYVSFANEEQKHYSWNEFVVDKDSASKEIQAFAKGEVSMIIGYAFTYDLIENEIDVLKSRGEDTIDKDAIRVEQIPQLYDPETSTEKRVTYANYFAEGVSRNSDNPDIAWDFLIFLTSKENLEYYFEKLNKPTSRRDMIDQQKKDPIYGVFASQVGFAESFPIVDYAFYKELFENIIMEANLEGAERQGLLDAQKEINELLPEEGFLIPKVVRPDEDE